MSNTVMSVGSLRETHEAAAESICSILQQKVDQETIRTALYTYAAVTEVKNVTIQNCFINGDRTINIDTDEMVTEE